MGAHGLGRHLAQPVTPFSDSHNDVHVGIDIHREGPAFGFHRNVLGRQYNRGRGGFQVNGNGLASQSALDGNCSLPFARVLVGIHGESRRLCRERLGRGLVNPGCAYLKTVFDVCRYLYRKTAAFSPELGFGRCLGEGVFLLLRNRYRSRCRATFDPEGGAALVRRIVRVHGHGHSRLAGSAAGGAYAYPCRPVIGRGHGPVSAGGKADSHAPSLRVNGHRRSGRHGDFVFLSLRVVSA